MKINIIMKNENGDQLYVYNLHDYDRHDDKYFVSHNRMTNNEFESLIADIYKHQRDFHDIADQREIDNNHKKSIESITEEEWREEYIKIDDIVKNGFINICEELEKHDFYLLNSMKIAEAVEDDFDSSLGYEKYLSKKSRSSISRTISS